MNKIIICLLSIQLGVLGAAFNSTDSIINVPIAKQYRANEIQLGFSHAYNGSASIQDTDTRYEMDFKTVYAINETNQVALNLTNPSKFIAHFQHTLSGTFDKNQMAVGLRNITEDSFSTWDNNNYVEDINMSPYIVQTFYTSKSLFSIGYGLRAFQHTERSLSGLGSFLENLNGLFFGFSYSEKIISFMAEYDGKDINLGLKIEPTQFYQINIGITEQFIDGDYNAQHAGAPKRQITFGISSKNLFSHNDHFNKKISDLNKKISEYEKRELERIDEQTQEIEVELITNDQVLKTKVANLYSKSLNYYNEREYDIAIHMLHEALEYDPTNYLILSRLGSIYYTYGFLDHASFYWKKAIAINPKSLELNEVKPFLKEYQ